ncbi:hypothetical protein NCR96_05060 [Helicobacter sp. 14348-15]|uniref:hypothetical protein n=1 Tax=Helicobacter colisuis TaxID=2949739 RepID=UPI00202B6047|nr:hypothetical protein [Helicobacter colisuis]MCL9821107.1 hypothetical protein [Helicobacter colisuis]
MQIIIESIALFALFCLGSYGILSIENQILYGIYFSFEALYLYTGYFAFALLFVGLWLPNPYGRLLGLLAFVAMSWHFLIFVYLDFGLNIKLIFQKILAENSLILGGISFLTSIFAFCASLANLFGRFKMYFWVYLIILLALLHILTQQKILSTLHCSLLIATLCALSLKIYKHIKMPKTN